MSKKWKQVTFTKKEKWLDLVKLILALSLGLDLLISFLGCLLLQSTQELCCVTATTYLHYYDLFLHIVLFS